MSRLGPTNAVREELIAVHATRACDRRAEAAGLLRTAGSLHLLPGGRSAFEAAHAHPGVARRIHEALVETLGHPDETRLEQPARGRPQTRYLVRVDDVSVAQLIATGLLDALGRPGATIPADLVAKPCCVGAYLRGAFLARGSVSAPRTGPHLEIRAEDELTAEALAVLLKRSGAEARVRAHRGLSAIVKDHDSVVTILATIGAHTAAMAREDASIWKGFHADASRLRNADAANAKRQARAAAEQLAAIAELEDRIGLARLSPALREIALLRLEQPDSTIEELARAVGITKPAAAGRLHRLVALANRR